MSVSLSTHIIAHMWKSEDNLRGQSSSSALLIHCYAAGWPRIFRRFSCWLPILQLESRRTGFCSLTHLSPGFEFRSSCLHSTHEWSSWVPHISVYSLLGFSGDGVSGISRIPAHTNSSPRWCNVYKSIHKFCYILQIIFGLLMTPHSMNTV